MGWAPAGVVALYVFPVAKVQIDSYSSEGMRKEIAQLCHESKQKKCAN